jgi:membrane protein DedA with SNARE-associated domain
MEARRFVLDTLSNAFGTIIAVGVIYLGGVVAGVITYDSAATALSIVAAAIGAVALFLVLREAKEVQRQARRVRQRAEIKRKGPTPRSPD